MAGPFFYSLPHSEPKRKYKFFVEFEGGEDGYSLSYFFPNNEYQWFVKSCTKPSVKFETTQKDETLSFFNTPVSTRKMNESANWNPIVIKFINPANHVFDLSNENKDLDYFFSNVMSGINPNFGGNFSNNRNIRIFNCESSLISAYISTLKDQKLISDFLTGSQSDKVATATAGLGGILPVSVEPITRDISTGVLNPNACRGSAESTAICKFYKYFGNIKIWDLGNGYFTPAELKAITDLERDVLAGDKNATVYDTNKNNKLDPSETIDFLNQTQRGQNKQIFNMGDTFRMGYWYLINPYIENIDVGSFEYASDELQEYTVTIGYDSAKYFSLLTEEGNSVNQETLLFRKNKNSNV